MDAVASRLSALLVAVAACGPGAASIPAPPDLPANGSVIFAYALEMRRVLVAVEADARPLFEADLAIDGALEVFALVYDAPLERLGLSPGVLVEAADPTACGARALPTPRRIHVVEARAGARGIWAPQDELPPSLASARLTGPCPCATFAIRHQAEADFEPKAGQETADGLVVIAPNGRLRIVTEAGRRSTDLGQTGFGNVQDLYVAPDGEIWVGARNGLYRGTAGSGFTRTATVEGYGDLTRIAGGPLDGSLRVHAVTSAGYLLQLAPRFEEIAVRRPGPAQSSQSPRLAQAPDGSLLGSEEGSLEVVHVDPSRRIRRFEVRPETRGINIIEWVDAVGFVGITDLSQVYLFQDDAWTERAAPDRAEAQGATRFRSGFVYAGDGGDVQEWHPDFGFCPLQEIPGFTRIRRIYALEDVLVLFGPDPENPERMLRTVLEAL